MSDTERTSTFDADRAKAFMGTMLSILNGGGLALMVSIGHRTGLFDSLASGGPATSEALAARTELSERYVREWLAAMTTGRILEHDPETDVFALPAEHAALVTRAGGPLNIANEMQQVAMLGKVEDLVVDAFRTGEGVSYDHYPAFHGLMAESSAARFDAGLVDEMIPNLPGAVDALAAGATLADVGCGQGYGLLLLAEAFPNASFIGLDLSVAAIDHANGAAAQRGLTNVRFEALDAVTPYGEACVDYVVTFDAIHDQAQPRTVLTNICNMLRPGGWYLCVEPKAATALADNMDEPAAPFLYTVSAMHCMSVSLAGGGEGLGAAWGQEALLEYLETAGFVAIDTKRVRTDRTNMHVIAQRPA